MPLSAPLPWLAGTAIEFPPLGEALDEPNGLLAAGGELSPQWLLHAYRRGIFPWYVSGQPILWWSPDPRMVLFPARLRISRSLRKLLGNHPYTFHMDRDFKRVVEYCGRQRQDGSDTWITPEMETAYNDLHTLGHAHSVEVWHHGDLAGGLYGIAAGKVFFGESMFSREPNTSKLALVALIRQLQIWDFQVVDCQVTSEHLISLGAEDIPRSRFVDILAHYAQEEFPSRTWQLDTQVNSMMSGAE